jgi:hypothetical protein
MQILILNLESQFENYSISDRGFLLPMIGMAIMKLSDDSQHSDLYEWKVKLLMLGRIAVQMRRTRMYRRIILCEIMKINTPLFEWHEKMGNELT